MSHNEAACLCNALLDVMRMLKPETAIASGKFFRERQDHGKERIEDRLVNAKRMRAIFFDERIDLTVIKETHKTTVETNKGRRGKNSTSESNEAETFVQRQEREDHCPHNVQMASFGL